MSAPKPFEGSAEAWDSLLLRLGDGEHGAPPHVLQSHVWGEIKARWGWRPTRLVWGPAGKERAAVQVLTRRMAPLPWQAAYAPRGPILASEGSDAWPEVLAGLASWSRAQRLVWLKMDPDISVEQSGVAALWTDAGWRRSEEQIQFANTMRSTLEGDDASLLQAMKAKTRYNIRLAERKEVRVRRGAGERDLEAVLELYVETARRQGFAIRDRAYYRDAWSAFLRLDRAVLLLAEFEGRLLAAALPVRFGHAAWYLYGASSEDERARMAPYAVTWEMLRWAREVGCTTFDWWGGPDALDEEDPLWGVFRFKAGFGATWAPQLGAWDLPARPLADSTYRVLARGRAALLSARRARRS